MPLIYMMINFVGTRTDCQRQPLHKCNYDYVNCGHSTLCPYKLLLHQLYLAKKTKVERKFIKEEKCRNATAFQVFLTQRNFLYAEYLTARFSWWSNISAVHIITHYALRITH